MEGRKIKGVKVEIRETKAGVQIDNKCCYWKKGGETILRRWWS